MLRDGSFSQAHLTRIATDSNRSLLKIGILWVFTNFEENRDQPDMGHSKKRKKEKKKGKYKCLCVDILRKKILVMGDSEKRA
jgi:hypothetical protein